MSKKAPSKKEAKNKEKRSMHEQLEHYGVLFARYRFTIIVIVFGLSVGYAIVRARTYSSVLRDETTYEQLVNEQDITTLKPQQVELIRERTGDSTPVIESSPTPGRTNPFTE
jgi:hypothetical protein